MRWTIAQKLFVVLVSTSALTLALSAGLGRWSFEREFLAYKSAQDSQFLDEIAFGFGTYYARQGDWSALVDSPQRWRSLLRDSSPKTLASRRPLEPRGRPDGHPPPPDHPGSRPRAGEGARRPPPPHSDPLNIDGRMGLYDSVGTQVAGALVVIGVGQTSPIMVAGTQVGELRLAPAEVLTEELDLRFAQGQSNSLILIALAVLALATLASLVLAPQLTRPIKRLANRARSMTTGNYEQQLSVVRGGELGSLADDMNELARTLEKNRRSRQQWIADISHELRTPLAILTAELQALEDGIREYNDGTRASLQLEVQRLNRLTQDLYELSAADEGTLSILRTHTDLVSILFDCIEGANARIRDHELVLDAELPNEPLILSADATRLSQLFSNLIENSLRYTDAPGTLRVRVERTSEAVEIVFEDSAPGVPEQLLPKVFERLYRLEPSRGRHSGGSGLGLAICKAIANAHDGQIVAEQSTLGGLLVRVTLPLTDNPLTT